MKIYISHSSAFEYNNLYRAIKNSKLMIDNEIFLPHEAEPINTKNEIGNFDLIIAEVSYPTTGQGIELGWGDMCNVPVLCIYKKGAQISSALKFITKNFIEYVDYKDMTDKVLKFLESNFS